MSSEVQKLADDVVAAAKKRSNEAFDGRHAMACPVMLDADWLRDIVREQARGLEVWRRDVVALFGEVVAEAERGHAKFGEFSSPHELYGVLFEEVCEFFDSVRADQPDAAELIQVAAVAVRGVLEMREARRDEQLRAAAEEIRELRDSNPLDCDVCGAPIDVDCGCCEECDRSWADCECEEDDDV